MTFVQAIILALTQGIAEFLPISSSGHLNIFQSLFRLTPSLTFDIFLNTATFLSVIVFFRQQIKYFFDNIVYIIIASLPAAFVGIFFKSTVESIFQNVNLLPYFFLITTFFVFSTRFLNNSSSKLTLSKALIIGLFQAVAILPGVSRAGTTIFAGLLLGLSPAAAFNFSFALFIPASLGALLLDVKSLNQLSLNPQLITAFLITFLTGLIALKLLKAVTISRKLWLFSFYTLLLALYLLIFKVPG